MSIQPPADASMGSCPVPGNTYVIAAPPNYQGPNNVMAGDRVIDGEHGANVKCSVHGSSTYTFSATIKGLTHTTPSSKVTLTITNGTINMDKMTGTATMAANTTELAGTFASAAGACTVTVVGDNVKGGSLWATATCPTITDPTAPGKACRIGTSTTFVLENCDGS